VVGTDEEGLAHVRDVEQARLGTRVQVFLENAEAVVDRHLIARERHHLGAKNHV
jgi:hypothetical protein